MSQLRRRTESPLLEIAAEAAPLVMNNFRVQFTLFFLGASLQAQNTAPPVYTADAAPIAGEPSSALQRTPQELEQLLAPIALYPERCG